MCFEIKNKSIFIADSHFNEINQEVLYLLQDIKNKNLIVSQIFLMGDIFDFLSIECNYFIDKNKKLINLINELSLILEIVYLEGNHDYNLKKIFPNVNVITRKNQPFLARTKNKSVSFSHGDNFLDWKYNFYSFIVRNVYFLKLVNLLDINNFISKYLESYLLQKDIYHDIKYFKKIVEKRIKNYSSQIVIEGHYHQGKTINIENKTYINISSLCCQKEYLMFIDEEFKSVKI